MHNTDRGRAAKTPESKPIGKGMLWVHEHKCTVSAARVCPLRLPTKGRFFPCCGCAVILSSASLWVCLGMHYLPARCACSWNVLVPGCSNQQEALGREGRLSCQISWASLWEGVCSGHVNKLQQYLKVDELLLSVHSAACMLTRSSICRVL